LIPDPYPNIFSSRIRIRTFFFYPGSRIRTFFHSGSVSKHFFIPDPE
jgi:hypothetical protein